MEISNELISLFSAPVEEHRGSYVIELPRAELKEWSVEASESYHVALISNQVDSDPDSVQEGSENKNTETEQLVDQNKPPVSVGEKRVVEIDEIGDQGDGITRVERGYVVIVPETEVGERVRIQIRHVRETVGFADVVERFKS